jgi:hypothetical protein
VKEKKIAKIKSVWGMVAVALALGMVLLGCPTDTEEQDTWSNVTSLSQMDGTWKISYSQTLTIQEFVESYMEGTWNDAQASVFGDIRVTVSVNGTMTINASAKTQAISGTQTMTFSGGNINERWGTIKLGMGSNDDAEIDDAKHSITWSMDGYSQTMTDDDIAEMLAMGLQINQTGTKIKTPASDSSPEYIATKQ